jgi:hypothetical protein
MTESVNGNQTLVAQLAALTDALREHTELLRADLERRQMLTAEANPEDLKAVRTERS